MLLENLGLSEWFKDKIDLQKMNIFNLARVVEVNKGSFIVRGEKDEVFAEMSGKLLFKANTALDIPTVGDWVYIEYFDQQTFAVIHEIFPRKTLLKRKTAGKKIEIQLLAANIDTAFIVQSLDFDYNLRRLERYFIMINESNIQPIVLLSKNDLFSLKEVEQKIAQIHQGFPGVKIISFSNINYSGIKKIEDLLKPADTICLLGSSGVGKTSLLNNLLCEDRFATKEIRKKDGKGKHATTRRQLTILNNGAILIDTPGLREIGNIESESGISITFDEITRLSSQCKFKNCSHIHERGCAVLAALKEGKISLERYQNYIKLKKESSFYEMSYLEKRQKDKRLGKFYKSVMKFNFKRNKI